jgi:hypothetical protein
MGGGDAENTCECPLEGGRGREIDESCADLVREDYFRG